LDEVGLASGVLEALIQPSEIFIPKLCWKKIRFRRQLSDESSVVEFFYFASVSFETFVF
jgi:hypothetical protein